MRACSTLRFRACAASRYRNLVMALPEADAKAVTDGVFRSIARLLLGFARLPDIDAAERP